MYDSQEISKVSQNLSLRLSPKRKYRPEIIYCPHCCCCPCKCCHSCHCCPCTCFLHSPSRLRSNNSLKNKYSPEGTGNMGSTNFRTNYRSQKKKYIEYEKNQFNDFLNCSEKQVRLLSKKVWVCVKMLSFLELIRKLGAN